MRTWNWKRMNWFASRFIFTLQQHPVGQLLFTSSWNWDAEYTDQNTKLRFAQKSFWSHDVLISQAGVTLGEIRFGLFAGQTLQLVSGERFVLSTSFWQQEVYWKTPQGETVITFEQATLSAMANGVISSPEALPLELERLLISSGIFVRQLVHKRTAVMIVALLPVFTSASRH